MKYILTFLALFIFTLASAKHDFTVLATKGEVFVVKGTDTSLVATGSKVYKGNSIILKEDAYCGLMHKSGKTLEVKKEGDYKIIDLEKRLSSAKSSYLEKYAKFALNQTKNTETEYSYNVTASVERGFDQKYNFLAPADGVEVVRDIPITISWKREADADMDVMFVVTDVFGEVLHSERVCEDYVLIDFGSIGLTEDRCIITLQDSTGKELMDKGALVKVVGVSEELVDEYESYANEMGNGSPMGSVMMGLFFEYNNMDSYAIGEYYHSIIKNNEIDYYNKLFKNVAMKNGVGF